MESSRKEMFPRGEDEVGEYHGTLSMWRCLQRGEKGIGGWGLIWESLVGHIGDGDGSMAKLMETIYAEGARVKLEFIRQSHSSSSR